MSKNKILSIIMYMATLLLLGFYAIVLLKGRTFSVSDEYRLYYIDHELNEYVVDGTLINYLPGRQYLYLPDGQYGNRGTGFTSVADYGCWAVGPETKMFFYIPEVDDMTFKLEYNKSAGLSNSLYVNDSYIADSELSAEPGYNVIELVVDKKHIHPGLNKFVLKPTEPVDDSFENIMVYSVGIYNN